MNIMARTYLHYLSGVPKSTFLHSIIFIIFIIYVYICLMFSVTYQYNKKYNGIIQQNVTKVVDKRRHTPYIKGILNRRRKVKPCLNQQRITTLVE